jgi:hypothetical protein
MDGGSWKTTSLEHSNGRWAGFISALLKGSAAAAAADELLQSMTKTTLFTCWKI